MNLTKIDHVAIEVADLDYYIERLVGTGGMRLLRRATAKRTGATVICNYEIAQWLQIPATLLTILTGVGVIVRKRRVKPSHAWEVGFAASFLVLVVSIIVCLILD